MTDAEETDDDMDPPASDPQRASPPTGGHRTRRPPHLESDDFADELELQRLVQAKLDGDPGAQDQIDALVRRRAKAFEQLTAGVEDPGVQTAVIFDEDFRTDPDERDRRLDAYPGVVARVDCRTGEFVWGVGSSGVNFTRPRGAGP
jgi:hypothetical protein